MKNARLLVGFFLLVALPGLTLVTAPAASDIINVSQTPGASYDPDLAVGPGHTLHFVWADSTTGEGRILYRRWGLSGWGDVIEVSDPGHDARRPSISIHPSNNWIFLVWEEQHASTSLLYGCISDGESFAPSEMADWIPAGKTRPETHVRPDGTYWLSWWSSDPTPGVYACNLSNVWAPFFDHVYCGPENDAALAEISGQLAVVSNVQSDPGCRYDIALWNGVSWFEPGEASATGGFDFDASSLPGSDCIHIAGLPGELPACPCWHLCYTRFDAADGWTEPSFFTETFGEWWFCTEPSVAVAPSDLPVVTYLYEELDDLWNTVRHDVVIARQEPGGDWQREYLWLGLEAQPQGPVVGLTSDFTAVAWSGFLDGVREINLHAPLSGVEDGPASGPSSLAGLTIHPNPSRGLVHIVLDGAASGPVAVEILNIAGRRVTDLVISPGRRTTSWDGNDDQGRRVLSGVYFVRTTGRGGGRVLRLK